MTANPYAWGGVVRPSRYLLPAAPTVTTTPAKVGHYLTGHHRSASWSLGWAPTHKAAERKASRWIKKHAEQDARNRAHARTYA